MVGYGALIQHVLGLSQVIYIFSLVQNNTCRILDGVART